MSSLPTSRIAPALMTMLLEALMMPPSTRVWLASRMKLPADASPADPISIEAEPVTLKESRLPARLVVALS